MKRIKWRAQYSRMTYNKYRNTAISSASECFIHSWNAEKSRSLGLYHSYKLPMQRLKNITLLPAILVTVFEFEWYPYRYRYYCYW